MLDESVGWLDYGIKQSNDRRCHAVESMSPLEMSLLLLAAIRSVKAFVCNLSRIVVGDAAVVAAFHVANTDCSTKCAHFSIESVCSYSIQQSCYSELSHGLYRKKKNIGCKSPFE